VSTTTGANLLARADRLTRQLRGSEVPVSRAQWETFDVTLHRLLHELIRPDMALPVPGDPTRTALTAAIRAYPAPLRPVHQRPLSTAEAARQLGHTSDWVHAQIRRGNLHAVHDGRDTYIPAAAPDDRTDITPADPTDPHPVARIAATLGALADLIHDPTTGLLLADPGPGAGAAVHVLAIGAVAARHTLIHGPLADANRPLAIAQYAERVIDTLHDPAQFPHQLDRIAAVTPTPAPETLNDQLEAAIHDWAIAGRTETERIIPSTDVLRAFANQGTHLYAVTLQVLQALEPRPESVRTEDIAKPLVDAGRALREADNAWAALTTATRPTHEFVTASRALFTTLQDVTTALETAPKALDKDRALGDLTRAADRLTALLAATEYLPERLIQSGLVYTPATRARPSPERLTDRTKARLVIAEAPDTPGLTDRWHEAVGASREAAHLVGQVRDQGPTPARADQVITRVALLEP